MEPDFSGYATKAGLKCSDGRVITPEAFQHQAGQRVPLVWQHGRSTPMNVLGYVMLEHREDGVYARGFFNDTEDARQAKALVQHGDIDSLSIFANQLVEKAKVVMHGFIREVSLVLSGANPGAKIDFINLQHSDGEVEELTDEALIYTGLSLTHSTEETEMADKATDKPTDDLAHTSMQEVYDSLDEDQKTLVHYMIGTALEQASAGHSGDTDAEDTITHQEGTTMTRNVFDQTGAAEGAEKYELTHDDVKGIVADAVKCGSLKAAAESFALEHGITNIDILFPDAKTISDTPEWDKRRTEWVAGVLGKTRHTPFSRIKTRSANITHDEARAKGYIKGNLKKEEFFGLTQRTTGPTTIYKKQKLDRDDVVDITDFDVVSWMKGEMRLMLEEELARAILIGDGRSALDEDKIKDPMGAVDGLGIRSIANDHDLYATTINVNLLDSNSSYAELIEAVLLNRKFYKGTGTPTFYTTETVLTKLLLLKDGMGRRLYKNITELADELRVDTIVPVEVMEGETDLVGIIVNLADYNVGADKGGELSMFDDFDIDYNQLKYLMETRISGALVKLKSALVIREVAGSDVLVVPAEPVFNGTSVTFTSSPQYVYKNSDTGLLVSGTVNVAAGTTLNVSAEAASGYYFANSEYDWSFTNDADSVNLG